MGNLIEGLIGRQRQCRQISKALTPRKDLKLATALIDDAVRRSEDAIASGDVLKILRSYGELTSYVEITFDEAVKGGDQ